MESLKIWAHKLRSEIWIFYQAATDPGTPWYAKGLVMLVLAYAFSPVDLIPDFIPVIGYLDDLILIPLGLYLASKLIPLEVQNKYRKATEKPAHSIRRLETFGALLVFGTWLVIIALLIYVAGHYIMEKG